jgi:hypothetical protein
MSHEPDKNSIESPYLQVVAPEPFTGFRPPTSNTTYTPNQFFDVVMPNASRGCLRIVAYLIRKTLGWCDADGNPQEEQIQVSYSELEQKAGVGHTMIRAALEEAVAGHFIECVRVGRAKTLRDNGQAASYSLKWDSSPEYIREPARFRGFYEGEGNRTDIPNQFFDDIIPNERAAVIAVVGSVIRYSIGFQAKHGARRQQATLSYGQILKASGLSSRRALASAIREALTKNYIVRLDPGYFSATIAERRSATYAIRWSDGFTEDAARITPKRIPADLGINHSEKDTSSSGHQTEKETSNAPKRAPADHSEKESIETKPLNEPLKQQAVLLLKKEGFNARTAAKLADEFPLKVIERQISWLDWRNPTKSRAGLLRRAIEENWGQPQRPQTQKISQASSQQPDPKFETYKDWLADEEADYRRNYPDDYARFEAKRLRDREDIYRERSTTVRATLLTAHDEPATRLLHFQKFIGLPDFWRWNAEFNNDQSNPPTS